MRNRWNIILVSIALFGAVTLGILLTVKPEAADVPLIKAPLGEFKSRPPGWHMP